MSLAEIKDAVVALPPAEVAELRTLVQAHANAVWDRQLDEDFAEGGRLRWLLDEARADAEADRLEDGP